MDGTQRWQRMQDGFEAASTVTNNFRKFRWGGATNLNNVTC